MHFEKGEVLWSTTYSMQTPVADFCGTTAAVAEQQGTQVFVFNADGLMGQFDTTLPILKVKVAKQGVVAVVLQDSNVTWINFYEPEERRLQRTGLPLTIPDIPWTFLCHQTA